MTDTKISALPARTSVAGTDEFPNLAGGVNYRSPISSVSGFTHQGLDAVQRTVQDRLRDTVHLLDYIPVAEHAAIASHTSTYDAIDGIHAAIAQFEIYQGSLGTTGPTLLLPHGKIHIGAPIQLKSATSIEGAGAAGSADQGYASIIEVAADQHGIIVHAYDTYDEDKAVTAAWASGATYVVGNVRYSVTTFSGIYECITAGGGTSTVRPVHAAGDVAYADGYTWRFLATARAGGGSLLRNFSLQSLGGTVGHGIWMRARATCYDINIKDFPQNGYNIVASVMGTGALRGNANNWRVYNGRVVGCDGAGLFADGNDGNAGLANGVDCSSNGGWGFWDDSFLGNVYVGCHTNGNGQLSERQYNRFTWICVSATTASTTAPGTDPAVWWLAGHIGGEGVFHETIQDWTSGTTYTGAATSPNATNLVEASNGGVYRLSVQGPGTSTNQPLHAAGALAYADGYTWTLQNPAKIWASGDTTIVEGGCFKLFSNAAVLLACYAEAGQPAQLDAGALAIYPGFGFGNLTEGSRGWLWAGTGMNTMTWTGTDSLDVDYTYQISAAGPGDFLNSFLHPTWSPFALTEKIDQTLGTISLLASNSNTLRTYAKTLANTTMTFGRLAPVPHAMFIDRLFVGQTSTVARQITNNSAAPTTGQWAAGDLVLNNAPLLGEPWGWRCILTGDFAATPPVFQPLRDSGSQQTIATGAAFTLTPGTSPYHTLYTGTITADRAVTLSTTGALIGLSYKITRTAAGAFNLNVGTGPLKALAVNTWCEVAFDGTAYYLAAYGAL